VTAFHDGLPGFAPTPLVDAPGLADRIGVRGVLIKDEGKRLGLGAFKVLGASWAAHVVLCERLGLDPSLTSAGELRDALGGEGPALITASAGNHGAALAWFARTVGLRARILLPAVTPDGPRDRISGLGAELIIVDGDYEATVAESARLADEDNLLIADTSWDGYERIPALVVDGYAVLMEEIDAQIGALGLPRPTALVVPVGVGSLATAVVRGAARWSPRPRLISVEPVGADPLAKSMAAGEFANAGPTPSTAMSGLNCAELSPIAWPELRDGIDGCLTVTDAESEVAVEAMRPLGVDARPCGGAPLGALLASGGTVVEAHDVVLLLVTEGETA
jgi:diaminopropionate ammonia-lyase